MIFIKIYGSIFLYTISYAPVKNLAENCKLGYTIIK